MPRNCPICGRFMRLCFNGPRPPEEGASYIFWCENCEHGEEAPEYNWLYWGIPDEEMERLRVEEPETFAEFAAMRAAYEQAERRTPNYDY